MNSFKRIWINYPSQFHIQVIALFLIRIIIGLATVSFVEVAEAQTNKSIDDQNDNDVLLERTISSPLRLATNKQRDKYRHPLATLQFFEVQPYMTVVEIWPGESGWYSEILAPYLRQQGKYYAAHFDPQSDSNYFRASRQLFIKKIKAKPRLYSKVQLTTFSPPDRLNFAPKETVDRILTFRNVHNWYMRGGGDANVIASFRAFYLALKPGGILGVVDHRLPLQRPLADQESSGYMREDYVIAMAEKSGFKFLGRSEINANPKDLTYHPQGVWTLPPVLRLGKEDQDKYIEIGESDRMTLKFIKP